MRQQIMVRRVNKILGGHLVQEEVIMKALLESTQTKDFQNNKFPQPKSQTFQ
jgi:hypothetical protein